MTLRFEKHQDGSASSYTAVRRPLTLVYAEEWKTISASMKRRRNISVTDTTYLLYHGRA